jgi:DNA-binding CsgD family transcriptional regulator
VSTYLRNGDLRAALDFVHEAATVVGGDDCFPPEVLEGLARLVPCDSVGYCELDRIGRRILKDVQRARVDEDHEELFWRIVPFHPLCRHEEETGDFSAMKLSDFVTQRRLHDSRVYSEWFRLHGAEHEIEVALPAPLSHTKTFLFDRGRGPDFSERDRAMLNLIQPQLRWLHELGDLRRRLARAGGASGAQPLTEREREVVALVREGLTNAQIARRLWISPNTVRRHLENSFAKLGVHTRTAAVRALSDGEVL